MSPRRVIELGSPVLIPLRLRTGEISQDQFDAHKHLNIVGLVGSIDNDMAGTDMTIGQSVAHGRLALSTILQVYTFTGATTALHRICEAVDSISSTASSHSRAFVIEVMGRNCGWLAIMAALATGADYMFIPERPPTAEDWKTSMCSVLDRVSGGLPSTAKRIVLTLLTNSIAKKGSAKQSSSSLREPTTAT